MFARFLLAYLVIALSGCDGGPGGGGTVLCTNTCSTPGDSECDDGGEGSLFSGCALGTDCDDCGPREITDPGPGGDGCGHAATPVWPGTIEVPAPGVLAAVDEGNSVWYWTAGELHVVRAVDGDDVIVYSSSSGAVRFEAVGMDGGWAVDDDVAVRIGCDFAERLRADIPSGSTPQAVDGAGNLYLTQGGGTIVRVRPDGAVDDLGVTARGAVAVSAGGRIAFSNDSGEVVVLDADLSELTRIDANIGRVTGWVDETELYLVPTSCSLGTFRMLECIPMLVGVDGSSTPFESLIDPGGRLGSVGPGGELVLGGCEPCGAETRPPTAYVWERDGSLRWRESLPGFGILQRPLFSPSGDHIYVINGDMNPPLLIRLDARTGAMR